MKTLRALIVEDSENDSQLLVMELRRGGWTVDHERVDTLDAMTVAIERQQWDLIIADFSMPQFSGLAALRLARSSAASVPFMLVSGTMGEATAVAAMKAGASDYLFKGDLSRLVPAVERELRAAEERETARETGRLLDTREAQLAEALRLSKLGTWNLNLQNDSCCWDAPRVKPIRAFRSLFSIFTPMIAMRSPRCFSIVSSAESPRITGS
jgi:DNA-binding response OmpR family regulator